MIMSDNTRIRLGMVGGGEGAFIGAVHRIAARMDNHYELIAGAFSSNAARAHASAAELGVDRERSYDSFAKMARIESAREDGIEVVSIVTPNHLHYPVAKAFLEAGIHVICDKPLTVNSKEANALSKLVADSGQIFAVTYNYSGYPMIRQAREMIARGDFGKIRVVQVEYPQDWLSTDIESSGQKQATWRTDPARSGAGGCIGDIGTHAYHLAGFVSGLKLESLSADITTFVEGRRLDDNAHVMLRFAGGARGMLWASQVSPGNENALRLRIYGEKAGLDWSQENPNQLWFTPLGEPKRLLTRKGAGTGDSSARITRIPAGHPEGYLEGFATLYSEIGKAIKARRFDKPLDPAVQFPTVDDGMNGVAFIEAVVSSSSQNSCWVKV